MTYQVIYNAMVSIVTAIHETYFPGTKTELQDILATLHATKDITARQQDALVTLKRYRNAVAHRGTGGSVPPATDIADAADCLVIWLKRRCPELDDPFSKFEGYYWLALCVVELCEKMVLAAGATRTTATDATGDAARSGEIAVLNHDMDSWFVRRGTFEELKVDMRETLKGRRFVILSDLYAGRRGMFLGWNGTNVKVKFDGDTKSRLLRMSTEVGILRSTSV